MNNHTPKLSNDNFFSLASSRAVVFRAIKVAIVCGTILVCINHGDKFMGMALSAEDWFKVLLTYLVPYCVSTWSAVGAMKANSSQQK